MGKSISTNLWRDLKSAGRLSLIAGPCVIESQALCLRVARTLKQAADRHQIQYIFKASYDKANRTSVHAFRGPGLKEGLKILHHVREMVEVPVLTDVHTEEQAQQAGKIVDILQIPAFLCRQTDLIAAAVQTGRIVNIKKGQFLSPQEMGKVIEKAKALGGKRLLVTERGTTFGYNNLVSDMRAIPLMRPFGVPVIYDATHSVQLPGGAGDRSGGQGEFGPTLAQCAVVAGADGIFLETHPNPSSAKSDGPNMVPLKQMPPLLKRLASLNQLAQKRWDKA